MVTAHALAALTFVVLVAAARQDGLKKGAFVRRVVLLHLRSGNGKERS
jgi:hypothetical protein